MTIAHAYAAQSATTPLAPFTFERRAPLARDVAIDILHCGVCHSDLHTVRNEWGGGTVYPAVPGHEIVGRVTAIGDGVSKFKVGDIVGVGCMVDSCQSYGFEYSRLDDAIAVFDRLAAEAESAAR